VRGLAFIGGEVPGPEALREIARGADLLAAADSGLAVCEGAGLRPDWVLGDMDSLDDPRRLEKYDSKHVRRFSPDKDFTDTELALALLREQGCGEVWIAGGGGGRLDHLFAIRTLFEGELPPDRWFPGNEEIRCIGEGRALRASLPAGSLVSLLPVGKEGWEAESSGLKWPLNGLLWERDRGGRGISNVVTAGAFEIRSVKGRFMVIMPMHFGKMEV